MTQGNDHFDRYRAAPGDCASVTSAANEQSLDRLRAEGFALAPIVEAVIAADFAGGLSEAETAAVAAALAGNYHATSVNSRIEFVYDVDSETLNQQPARTQHRLEGVDGAEVVQVLPMGINVSQLAPYRCWEDLFERFCKDMDTADSVLGHRPISRLAVRSINRIDVPLVDGIARYEDYLAVHVALPAVVGMVNNFFLRVGIPVPQLAADAIVQSTVMEPAAEGFASFVLDIDLARVRDIPPERAEMYALLGDFRKEKNLLYRGLLTEHALKEFK